MRKKLIILSTILLIAAISALSVYALTYDFSVSNSEVGTQNPEKPVVVTVSASLVLTPKTWDSGQSITLTATLNPKLSGVAVDYFMDGTYIGSEYTDGDGVATYTYTPASVLVQTQRVFTAQPHQ